jgi:beta-glucanase (GH16 family)
MSLIYNEEFDSQDDIDTLTFSYLLGDSDNGELQEYTSEEENIRVEDSTLVIAATRQIFNWFSARIVTLNKREFTTGRVDVRAKLPFQAGIWPIISLENTDTTTADSGSIAPSLGAGSGIDFVSILDGNDESTVGQKIRYRDEDSLLVTIESSFSFSPEDSVDFSDDFHIYSVKWTEDCINFEVDGVEVGEPVSRSVLFPSGWPFDQEMYLSIGLDVGGNNGPGSPSIITPVPQELIVDYIKVYQ